MLNELALHLSIRAQAVQRRRMKLTTHQESTSKKKSGKKLLWAILWLLFVGIIEKKWTERLAKQEKPSKLEKTGLKLLSLSKKL